MSAKKKILIVEDDPDILESLEVTLRINGFDVVALPGGKELSKSIETRRPDLILMDVMMPPPDGYELCRSLKSNDQTKDIPVVLLSARTERSNVETGFKAGADRYMSKPFLNEDLVRTITGLLG